MKKLLLLCLISILTGPALIAQTAPEKSSPFTAVKWVNDQPSVQFQGEWFEPFSIDGVTVERILKHCKEEHGRRYQKRFSEDLVEIMGEMGYQLKPEVKLVLKMDGRTVVRTGQMTEANRRMVWTYNQENEAGNSNSSSNSNTNTNTNRNSDRNSSGSHIRNAKEMLAQGYKRYEVESGMVEYKLEGNSSGTETLYFDMWGWREARYSKSVTKFMGIKSETETVSYLDGEWMINYNPETDFATRTSNPMFKNLAEGAENKNMTEVGREMFKSMGGEQQGNETVSGYNCERWHLKDLNTTAWVHKGVSLKEHSKLMGMEIEKTATKVQFGVKPPSAKLIPPADAKTLSSPLPGH